VIWQAFRDRGASWVVCASCLAGLEADGDVLVMAHADGCSQVLSVAAQARGGER
jgi:hypothetical protein